MIGKGGIRDGTSFLHFDRKTHYITYFTYILPKFYNNLAREYFLMYY